MADSALQQIDGKNDTQLKSMGITKIVKYGIAFCARDVEISSGMNWFWRGGSADTGPPLNCIHSWTDRILFFPVFNEILHFFFHGFFVWKIEYIFWSEYFVFYSSKDIFYFCRWLMGKNICRGYNAWNVNTIGI